MTEKIYKTGDLEDEDILAENLADLLKKSVERFGDKTAFSCMLPGGYKGSITYRDIDLYSDAVAAFLRVEIGLKPGDVVAIQSPNTLSYPIVAFGILKAGLTVTNINPLYTSEETQHQLSDSGAKLLFVIDLFGDKLQQSLVNTKVEKVYSLSLVDFFPPFKQKLISFVMKRVKKLIPTSTAPIAGRLNDAIRLGMEHVKSGRSADDYWKNIDKHSPAFYQYTGGTTGRSKGAVLTHYNLVANISQGHKRNKISFHEGEETMILALPLYHVYALAVGAIAGMYQGTHIVLVPVPRPLSNLKPVFEQFDITVMPGVNTLYLALMQESWFNRRLLKKLRICIAGGAPLQPQTSIDWENFTGVPIHEGYGLTEATCMVSAMNLEEVPPRGTCGKPFAGTEIRIVKENNIDANEGEPGELWVRGPQVMQKYLGRPSATAETITSDGWLRTGDVAVINGDGNIKIVDRMKDMVIVSGFNVYPTDIEDVLTNMDQVVDAAVVGVPSSETGEQLIAYIIPANPDVTREEIIAHCRQHLTAYKVPKTYVMLEEFPKSAVGKVLRRELRSRAIEEFSVPA